MRKSTLTVFATAIVLALAVPVLAGGFWITLGNADANSEAHKLNAVLTIKPAGCHEPEKAAITAVAIGMRDGRRESIPLKLSALSEPGTYAVTRQWPVEGRWVLQFVATDHDRATSVVVAAGPGGIERDTAKFKAGQPAPEDIAALLDPNLTPGVAKK